MYEQDSRLRGKLVRVEPGVGIPLRLAVRRLRDATGVPLKCEPGLAGRFVAVGVLHEEPAPRLMRALAVAVSARWVRSGDAYVLCRLPELARVADLTEAQLSQMLESNAKGLLESLTEEQAARLSRGEKVPFDAFTPRQRRHALDVAVAAIAGAPEWYRAEALTGAGIYLQRGADMQQPARASIGIFLPSYVFGSEDVYSYPLP
jgi:hypothetical protein